MAGILARQDLRQDLETFWVVTTQEVPWAEARAIVIVLQWTGRLPPERITCPPMSVSARLRNSDLDTNFYIW